jgi:formylglycine-generating enzyme required for sulfatase activity
MLPTQAQWRYAAQGDDGRHYPWGNEWDNTHCNHNVNRQGIGKTTPVQQFEGRGDSPFGVVDMAGNVWEWCLTEYVGKKNDVNSTATERVLHGGSWNSFNYGSFRCDNNLRHFPSYRDYGIGFRLSRT